MKNRKNSLENSRGGSRLFHYQQLQQWEVLVTMNVLFAAQVLFALSCHEVSVALAFTS
jgi:hypothetical protein